MTFTDDKSRYCAVFLLRSKSEVLEKFVHLVKFAETQTGRRIKVVHSDNGGEYVSDKFAVLSRLRHRTAVYATVHAPAQWSGQMNEMGAGRECSMHDRARGTIEVLLR